MSERVVFSQLVTYPLAETSTERKQRQAKNVPQPTFSFVIERVTNVKDDDETTRPR